MLNLVINYHVGQSGNESKKAAEEGNDGTDFGNTVLDAAPETSVPEAGISGEVLAYQMEAGK